MRCLLAIIVASLLAMPARAATSQPADTHGTESLGGKLLDDLSPTTPDNNPANEQPATEQLAPRRVPSGWPRAPEQPPSAAQVPLFQVRQGMQHAQLLLNQPVAPARAGTVQLARTVQQEVVIKLDKLIAELSKQCNCQGGQCKPGDKPPSPNQRSQSKPGKSGSAAGRGRSAARDSTDRLDRASAHPVDKGDVNELVKALWGHLPERSREQMMQSFSDDFLPKYELEIEQYYRRLSEEQTENSPSQ